MAARIRAIVTSCTAGALAALLAPAVAHRTPAALAQEADPAPLDRVVELNKDALAEYEQAHFERARDLLLQAVVIGKEAGLGSHQAIARTYLHVGAVYVAGLKDEAKGRRYFGLALKLRPEIQVTSALHTPEVEKVFADAGGKSKAPPSAAAPRPTEPPPVKRTASAEPAAPPPPPSAPPPPEPAAITPESAATAALREEVPAEPASRDWPTKALFVSLSIGSGIGAHGGGDLENHKTHAIDGGINPVGVFHLGVEIGYQLTDVLGLSLQTRHQFIQETGYGKDSIGGPQRVTHAVLAKASYQLASFGKARLLGLGLLGAGAFRLVVPENRDPAVMLRRNDTLKGGPIVVGPGLALAYPLVAGLSAVAEARLLVGVPSVAGELEGNLGARYAF